MQRTVLTHRLGGGFLTRRRRWGNTTKMHDATAYLHPPCFSSSGAWFVFDFGTQDDDEEDGDGEEIAKLSNWTSHHRYIQQSLVFDIERSIGTERGRQRADESEKKARQRGLRRPFHSPSSNSRTQQTTKTVRRCHPSTFAFRLRLRLRLRFDCVSGFQLGVIAPSVPEGTLQRYLFGVRFYFSLLDLVGLDSKCVHFFAQKDTLFLMLLRSTDMSSFSFQLIK